MTRRIHPCLIDGEPAYVNQRVHELLPGCLPNMVAAGHDGHWMKSPINCIARHFLTCPRVACGTVAMKMTLADLVADSEDEEYLFHSKGPLFYSDHHPPPRSRLTETCILLPDLLQPRKATNPPQSDPLTTTTMAGNAVASTSRGEARAEPTVVTKKPRPKPKKKPPTGSIDAAPSAPPSDYVPTTTAVPRTSVTTALPQTIPPVESRPQNMALTIADRAKSRVRNAKSKLVAPDIIDIPSDEDEDERLLRLSPHRPKQKDVRGAKGRPIPNPPPPSIHPSQESLVTPTSDFQPAPAVSSQLPPSDPPSSTLPLPTSTPESAKKRRQVADTDDADKSPLNPSKKRKRQHVIIDDDKDKEARLSPPRVAVIDQPPPNFFASSSSSLPPPPAPVIQGGPRKKEPVKRKQPTHDVPPPEVVDSGPPREKKGRPKPKRKSVVHPEPTEAGQPSSVSASTSRPKSNAKDLAYKSAEIVDDSDEEVGSLVLPPPPPRPDSQSPLSDLSEPTGSGSPKPTTPSKTHKRLIPEVVITTVPKKRNSSLIREAEGRGSGDRDGVNGSPKGKKRQKKAAEDYFDGIDDEVEAVPKKGSKGKGKAPPKGKSRAKPRPKEVVEFEEDLADDATGTGKKAKSRVKAKAATKTKSTRSGKSRVVDSDDEVTADTIVKDPESVLVGSEQMGDSSVAQQNAKGDETPPPQDAKVSFNVITSSETVLTCDFQGDQENTPPPPKPVKSKSNPPVTPSSVSGKTPAPSSASSFTRLNYGHSIASEEKPMSMAEIIRRANSAGGTPSGIKSHSSFMKGSRSVLKRIAPLHARRKTPPPLPPKPPPPKKTKKQLELEEKWEEELEETIEGWVALSSQEREVLRKQKRDMEMGYED